MLLLVTVVAAACSTQPSPAKAAPAGRVIGPFGLGVNLAAWDDIYGQVDPTTVTDALKVADLALIRYPGGSWADEYDWETNTDSSNCPDMSSAPSCDGDDALSFGSVSARARAAGASIFATVNYGSGTPAQAAAWVTRATTTTGEGVALWEVGNETYSCSEVNQHLAEAPTFVQGYTPNSSVCPSTAVLATSYGAHAPRYVQAMKQASPTVRVGVPWAFSHEEAAGAGIPDASVWNARVLRAVKGQASFVDAHWYPFNQVTGLSTARILLSTRRIPAAAAQIRSTLRRDAPGAKFVIGEANISAQLTTLDFQPVSALFAAATSLAWLSQGAESVDWWDLNNFGTPSTGDFGLLSSGGSETEPEGTPFPSYYGEALASKLTAGGSRVTTVATGSSDVLGFQSTLGNRSEVLLVNPRSSATSAVTSRWFAGGSDLEDFTYSAATAEAPNPIVQSNRKGARVVTLPAESIVVLTGP